MEILLNWGSRWSAGEMPITRIVTTSLQTVPFSTPNLFESVDPAIILTESLAKLKGGGIDVQTFPASQLCDKTAVMIASCSNSKHYGLERAATYAHSMIECSSSRGECSTMF